MIQPAILEKLETLPNSLQTEVLHYIEFLSERYTSQSDSSETQPKKKRSGILEGMFSLPLPDDFDEPLDDFAEYMS
ncbi:MAG: DUF2281 domain-containing protein [Spirulina sp. SIO3F2]|nr:DUF2281 domain-containing protein [Spirulina sp. SIO3F2]